MKKILLLFSIAPFLYSCNKDDATITVSVVLAVFILPFYVLLVRSIFRINKIVENQEHHNYLLWRILQSLIIDQANLEPTEPYAEPEAVKRLGFIGGIKRLFKK